MRNQILKGILPLPFIIALAVSLGVAPASAGTVATPSCVFSSTGITFSRSYDVFAPNQYTSVGKIYYNCTGFSKPVSVKITLSPGYSGNYAQRAMRGPLGAVLNYQLHEGSLDVEWGNGVNGWAYNSIQSPDGTGKFGDSRSVQAKIMPGQDVPAGNYSDVIVGTFTYNF